MQLAPRVIALASLAVLLARAPAAEANSCIDVLYERLELELLRVERNGQEVPLPPELGELEEALNSGDQGKAIMVRNQEWKRWWFIDGQRTEPTPQVAAYLEGQAERTMDTACGYPIDYVPMWPGTYRYEDAYAGEDSHPALTDFTFELRPGRDQLWLRFSFDGGAYLVRYLVRCASFGHDGGDCGPSEPSSPEIARSGSTTSGATGSGTVAPPPSGQPSAGKPGCRGCGTSGGDAGAWALVVAAVVGARRRRRAGAARS